MTFRTKTEAEQWLQGQGISYDKSLSADAIKALATAKASAKTTATAVTAFQPVLKTTIAKQSGAMWTAVVNNPTKVTVSAQYLTNGKKTVSLILSDEEGKHTLTVSMASLIQAAEAAGLASLLFNEDETTYTCIGGVFFSITAIKPAGESFPKLEVTA